jgi:hypothetical protein
MNKTQQGRYKEVDATTTQTSSNMERLGERPQTQRRTDGRDGPGWELPSFDIAMNTTAHSSIQYRPSLTTLNSQKPSDGKRKEMIMIDLVDSDTDEDTTANDKTVPNEEEREKEEDQDIIAKLNCLSDQARFNALFDLSSPDFLKNDYRTVSIYPLFDYSQLIRVHKLFFGSLSFVNEESQESMPQLALRFLGRGSKDQGIVFTITGFDGKPVKERLKFEDIKAVW